MTFVSFAQNFEDVMLWRALKGVSEGFYIDVGAADPNEESVTRAFYDRGWRGVNVEPEPRYAEALRAARPRDINLEMALGSKCGKAILHRIAGTGLSTFDAASAAQHAAAGYPVAEAIEVEVSTLRSIVEAHNPPVTHFLKIDAEGAERAILHGADLRTWRPWIIVIEATKPFSQERTTDDFEDLILGADYRFRWFDGVNAYYIAAEHDERLRAAFELPPNFFDNFVKGNYLAQAGRADEAEAKLASEQEQRRQTEERLAAAQEQLKRTEAQLGRVARAVEEHEEQLALLHASTSWRATAPLRWIIHLVRRN